MNSVKQGLRASALGIVANLLLAVAKVISGVLGNSYALIADGVESAADVFTSAIVWGGLRIAAMPADEDHPYGHGKAESMAGLAVAILLIGAALAISIQSVREILAPQRAPHPFTLAVLVAVIAIKEWLFRRVLKTGIDLGSNSLKGDAWHHRSDAITSFSAFVGISIACIGGSGYESADDWAALLACSLIAWNGVKLLRPAINEIMDASPESAVIESIRQRALEVKNVAGIGRCRVRKSGLELFVDIHIKVPGDWTVHAGHELAHQVEDQLRHHFAMIRLVSVHVEPCSRSDTSPQTLGKNPQIPPSRSR